MARARKIKIKLYNMDISAPDITNISMLQDIIIKASLYERSKGHLLNHSDLIEMSKDIDRQVSEYV